MFWGFTVLWASHALCLGLGLGKSTFLLYISLTRSVLRPGKATARPPNAHCTHVTFKGDRVLLFRVGAQGQSWASLFRGRTWVHYAFNRHNGAPLSITGSSQMRETHCGPLTSTELGFFVLGVTLYCGPLTPCVRDTTQSCFRVKGSTVL